MAENLLRHRSQELYCDSYSCDGGYTPVPKAEKVACDDNKCTDHQCCELLCSCYMCPEDYSSVKGFESILCEDSGCTQALCCDKDGEGLTSISKTRIYVS